MTQHWLVAFLLLLAPAPSRAGEPVPAPAGLILHVVDMDGQPISGATVQAGMQSEESGGLESPAWAETTPAEGTVRLTDLPVDGIVWLLVERKGFFPELRNVKLGTGGRREVKVELRPGGIAVGRVVDEAGRPVAGAEVEIEGSPFDLWTEKLPAFVRDLGTHRARTGPAGLFRFRDLPEGDFELTIRHPSFVPFQGDRPIQGGRSGHLGRFVLRRGEALRGLVTDPEGQPVAGLPLWAATAQTEQEETPPPSTTTGPDGTFEILHLPPGELELFACGPGYVQQSVTVRFLDEPVLLTLKPAATLRGQVLGPEGRPQAGVSVFAELSGVFSPGCGYAWTPCGSESSASTDAEGRFEIGPLAPGWYDLTTNADGPRTEPVASVRAVAGEVTEGIEIRWQGETGEEEAPAADDESELLRVRGRVVGPDGTPVERAQVVAGSGATTWSLADGSFELRLPPRGTAKVWANKPGFAVSLLWVDPAELPAGGIEIRLKRGATVNGRVLGLIDEERGRQATIQLTNEYGQSLSVALRSDDTFQVPAVAPGSWDVAVWTGRRVAETMLVVQPGQSEVSLDVEMEETHTVTGEVLDELGEPIGGADLHIWNGHMMVVGGARANGRFTFLLADGEYQIRAEKKGFHSAEIRLQVDGAPVDGLEVRLAPSTTLSGRLYGLAPGEMPWIAARGSTAGLPGEVELDRYWISDLGPGTWTIEATLRNEGTEQRVIRRTIEIPPGGMEMELDLDFAETEAAQ